MSHFFKSATQFVLVLFSIILSISLLYVVIFNVNDQTVVSGLKDLFANAMVAVISFYFGQKGLPNGATVDTPVVTTVSTTSTTTE